MTRRSARGASGRRRPLLSRIALTVAMTCACRAVQPDIGSPVLAVQVRDGAIQAPDSIDAGWIRLSVTEMGAGHIVVLFALDSTRSDEDFASALDRGSATPAGAVARGGPEIGTVGEVQLELMPGRYVLACVGRDAAGHRHAVRGEARAITVYAAAVGKPVAAPADTLRLADFAFVGADTVPSGDRTWRVENVGDQDHQVRVARLPAGATLGDWIGSEGAIGADVIGVARLGAGQSAHVRVDLGSGTYVIYCLVRDPGSGRPHLDLGMFRTVQAR